MKGRNAHLLWQVPHHLPLLEVGLSVQIGRLDVTHSVGVGGVQQHHVRRDDLITEQPHQVPHTHISPALVHILMLLPTEHTHTHTHKHTSQNTPQLG